MVFRFKIGFRLLTIACILHSAASAQDTPDEGNTDELSQAANIASNAIDLMPPRTNESA